MDRLERLEVDPAARTAVAKWLELLGQWNARIDLTAARNDDELFDLMLADAVLFAKHVPQGVRIVDIGSGAGAPGLALALIRPDLRVTLVEPLAKRVAFLRTVIGTLSRSDVTLVQKRANDAPSDGFDVAISRATLPPTTWVPEGLRLAPATWVLLAKDEPPVVDGAVITTDVTYPWPLTQVTRRAVRYDRVKRSG